MGCGSSRTQAQQIAEPGAGAKAEPHTQANVELKAEANAEANAEPNAGANAEGNAESQRSAMAQSRQTQGIPQEWSAKNIAPMNTGDEIRKIVSDNLAWEAELAPLNGEKAPYAYEAPPTFSRWPQLCCLAVCSLIVFLLLSIVALALYLFGFGGTISVMQGDYDAVSQRPFGANNVPLARTFGFPKIDALNFSKAPNEVVVRKWDEGTEIGNQQPSKEWSGEWTRGNELGFLVYNPFFWEGIGIDPPSIGLGIKPNQHAAIRRYLETLFHQPSREESQDILSDIRSFLKLRKEAGSLTVQRDLQVMVYQLLYKYTFGKRVSEEDANKFVDLQQAFLTYGVVTEALPGFAYPIVGGLLGMQGIQDGIAEYVRKFRVMLEERFGSEMAGLDCSPSPNCTLQLASAVFDGLCAAGGASVPQAIGTGIGVIYSESITNPVRNNTKYTKTTSISSFTKGMMEGKEQEFFWEVIRYFPPVVGVPHWESIPHCPGVTDGQRLDDSEGADDSLGVPAPTPGGEPTQADSPDVATAVPAETTAAPEPLAPPNCLNQEWVDVHRSGAKSQWGMGKRVIINVAGIMQKDRTAWGKDARKFTLRDLDTYRAKSIGFAEMLRDDSVQDGKMNRVCPGKNLALSIGTAFFKAFNPDEWTPSTTDILLQPAHAKFTVSEFSVLPKEAPTSRRLDSIVV